MLRFFRHHPSFFFLISACVLFGISSSVTAWFCFVPVLFLVSSAKWSCVWLWGFLYGSLSYLLYVPWLFTYSPLALIGVCFVYAFYCMLLFLLLKAAEQFCKEAAPFVQCALLVLYEYVKTVGFLGFSYGINGYTQYKNIYFIQTADLFGVFGVSAVLNFSSVVLYRLIRFVCARSTEKKGGACVRLGGFLPLAAETAVLALSVVFSYCYGFYRISRVEERQRDARRMTVAAVQNNADPWKGGVDSYRKDVRALIALSAEVLENYPETELVVWPETAVVPSILKHYYAAEETGRKKLVTELLEFIDGQNAAFLIGNCDTRGEDDFNSAFLFRPGQNVIPPAPEIYSKIHLVPLSEYFPYEKQFPRIYDRLLDGGSHLWTPGNSRTVMNVNGLHFAVPICFEDSFGSDMRKFVQNGAAAFMNMSNDAWANSSRAQTQHLQNAVFRSVENHVPSVRSTASGVTCIIDSCGRITERCDEFCGGYAVGTIPVLERQPNIATEEKIR